MKKKRITRRVNFKEQEKNNREKNKDRESDEKIEKVKEIRKKNWIETKRK